MVILERHSQMRDFSIKYIWILSLFFLLFSCSEEDAIPLIDEDNSTEIGELTIADEILALVNQHREEQGLAILKRNSTADDLSVKHTHYMIAQGEISHDNFNARFQELQRKVNAKGAGENVASGYRDAISVMNGWLNSSGHKANIEGNYTHIGLAAIKNAQGRYFYTQLFYR